MPVTKLHPNILGIQPNLDAILYTHFDAWEMEHDSKEAADFAKELCEEWTIATGIDFSALGDKYSALGQIPFFAEAANIFAEKGYLVYDGDAFFEVYNLPTIDDLSVHYDGLKNSDDEIDFDDDYQLAIFAQLPNLLEAVKQLKVLKDHLDEALWTSIFDPENSEEVKAAEESGIVTDLAAANAVLEILGTGKPLIVE